MSVPAKPSAGHPDLPIMNPVRFCLHHLLRSCLTQFKQINWLFVLDLNLYLLNYRNAKIVVFLSLIKGQGSFAGILTKAWPFMDERTPSFGKEHKSPDRFVPQFSPFLLSHFACCFERAFCLQHYYRGRRRGLEKKYQKFSLQPLFLDHPFAQNTFFTRSRM